MRATVERPEVVVMLRLQFKPGTVDLVLERMLPIARITREEVGNIEFNVYQERDKGDRLVVFERWIDQAALERHWQQDYTREVLGLFALHLAAPLSEGDDVTYLSDVMVAVS